MMKKLLLVYYTISHLQISISIRFDVATLSSCTSLALVYRQMSYGLISGNTVKKEKEIFTLISDECFYMHA